MCALRNRSRQFGPLLILSVPSPSTCQPIAHWMAFFRMASLRRGQTLRLPVTPALLRYCRHHQRTSDSKGHYSLSRILYLAQKTLSDTPHQVVDSLRLNQIVISAQNEMFLGKDIFKRIVRSRPIGKTPEQMNSSSIGRSHPGRTREAVTHVFPVG